MQQVFQAGVLDFVSYTFILIFNAFENIDPGLINSRVFFN